MKVMELLEEIEEIVDTASGFLLTGKIMVDSTELLEIVKEIKTELPDEIKQARWIVDEKDRILRESRNEYETIITEAKRQAEDLIDNDEIMLKAKHRATELMKVTEANVRQLKMSTYDYVDGILFDFQEKMDELTATYFTDMFHKLEITFNEVNVTLASNREEIKEMAYRTSMNISERGGQAEVKQQIEHSDDQEEEYGEE